MLDVASHFPRGHGHQHKHETSAWLLTASPVYLLYFLAANITPICHQYGNLDTFLHLLKQMNIKNIHNVTTRVKNLPFDITEKAFGKREKRRLGSGKGRRGVREETKKEMPGSLYRAAWAVKQTFSEGRCSGGPHMRLSRRTRLIGVSLASGYLDYHAPSLPHTFVIVQDVFVLLSHLPSELKTLLFHIHFTLALMFIPSLILW